MSVPYFPSIDQLHVQYIILYNTNITDQFSSAIPIFQNTRLYHSKMPMMKNSIFEDVMSVHSAQLLNENIPHFYLIFVKLEFASIACVFLVVDSYTREFVVERYRGLIV